MNKDFFKLKFQLFFKNQDLKIKFFFSFLFFANRKVALFFSDVVLQFSINLGSPFKVEQFF